MICRNAGRRTPYSLDRVPSLPRIQARRRRPRPGLFIMAITPNSVILSKALAFAFPTRLFCGSGERGVEGSAVSSATMPILTDHRSLDSARAAHPGKSRRDAVLLRASLRRKSFTTETRRTRSFGFYRVFSVISVPPWWIFIPRGGPKVHTTLGMNNPMFVAMMNNRTSATPRPAQFTQQAPLWDGTASPPHGWQCRSARLLCLLPPLQQPYVLPIALSRQGLNSPVQRDDASFVPYRQA